MHPTVRPLSIACLYALFALGCASTSQPSAQKSETAPPTPVADTAHQGDRSEIALSAADAPALAPIYFATDRSSLDSAARDALKSYASAILQHPEWGVVTIEGHCDERGSEEYNLALGSRRATAVARYLGNLGVPSTRLTTRSYGELRPVALGHDELAWHQNRRAVIGGDSDQVATR